MAILLTAQSLTHRFGARPLFEDISFTIAEGDRIGLIGPNGAGKTTLLRILGGQLAPDEGKLSKKSLLRVGHLAQMPSFTPDATVRDTVLEGLAPSHRDDWEHVVRAENIIAKLDLGAAQAGLDTPMERLSGGWKKRVALARELVREPDLLLLDEPTNHLDVESILWLEALLANSAFATLTITHDRAFLQKAANRILELDRRNAGGLLDVAGDYATYVERKEELMNAQERREQTLKNTLRRETEWLRRGPPARSTKQEARIQRAGALAAEVADLSTRNQSRGMELDFAASGRQPKRLIEAVGISKRYGERPIFGSLDLFIGPGSRVGLLGPNGCGKSTLLRILVGDETPTTGTVRRADGLTIATFEQNRESLDPDLSLANTVCPDGDFVDFRGARIHRRGYLERFLFRAEQADMAVRMLSGGEQSRLLIARLMLRPAQVLVLDEPTNDLDLATLNVLQDALVGFEGAVLLVTHDRFFLDQVATQILAFHTRPGEEGRLSSFSSLRQWEEWHPSQLESRSARGDKTRANAADGGAAAAAKPKKLSFKDQRDWETIEARIADAEARRAALQAQAEQPHVATNGQRLIELQAQLAEADRDITQLYERWAFLEALRT